MKAAIRVLGAALLLIALAACQGAYLMEIMQEQVESMKAQKSKTITAFSFARPAVTGTINENAKTIAVTMPYGTDVTALVATFTTTGSSVTVGSAVQVSGVTANNFTTPIIYTVTAADGSTASYTVTVTAVPRSGLVAEYLFSGNAADTSGYGHNGVVHNVIATSNRFGVPSGAYYFDNSYIEVSDPPGHLFNPNSSFSISAWLNLANDSALESYPLTAQDEGSGSTNKWFFSYRKYDSSQNLINALSFHVNSPSMGSAVWINSNPVALQLNTWHHVALVRDGVTFRFYVDSVSKGNVTSDVSIPEINRPLTIGYAEVNDYLIGSADDVRIYNRALTTEEVSSLFHEDGWTGGGTPLSSDKTITAFSFASPAATGTIDENAKTIAVTVPYGTNVTALVATFTTTGASVRVGSTVQVSSTTANNFSSPIIYAVTAADGSTASYTVTVTIAPENKVATPTFSPPAGAYSSDQSVTISCATSGAEIHYTTDGTTPSGSSAVYSSPIVMAGNGTTVTLKAIATKAGMTDSEVASAGYTINYGQASTPTFSPGAGTYTSAQTVTISTTTAGASIRYTTDGSTPTSMSGTLYSGPISVATSMTIKAIAYESGCADSLLGVAGFTIISWQTLGSAGSGTNQFRVPNGVTVDASGHIYVTDGLNNRIVRMDDMSGTGWIMFGGYFSNPWGIAVDASGHIYIADRNNYRIVRIDDMSGTGGITLGSRGSETNQFDYPYGVAVDASGHIYVADANNNRIVRMDDMSGTGWTILGSLGSGINQFHAPFGVAVDSNGHIYVADDGNHRIVRMNDMAGTGWTTLGSNGNGINQFSSPWGIAIDTNGHICVVDVANSQVVRMNDMSGDGWTALGSFDNGANQLRNPYGLAVDANGYIYVDDTGHNRIVRIFIQ